MRVRERFMISLWFEYKTDVYMNCKMFILLYQYRWWWTAISQSKRSEQHRHKQGEYNHEAAEGERNRKGSTLSPSQKRKKQKKKRRMGKQEHVWWSSGGVYLEGLPELISQSADLREDVTDEKGLWHAAAPQRDQVLHQLLCSLELRFGKTRFYWWRFLKTFLLLTLLHKGHNIKNK